MNARPMYWLDADVYIQASRGPYKRFPEFWSFLAAQLELGRIKSPKIVYDELTMHWEDDLKNWCTARREKGLCVNASRAVQEQCLSKIAEYVYQKYPAQRSSEFLRGGDAWVIAHAMDSSGVVVTQESLRKMKSKIKVPTICKAFQVDYINTYELLDRLNFRVGTT